MTEYVTITAVVRGTAPEDLDHAAVMALLSEDEILFASVENGVTDAATAAGADPSMWEILL